MATAKKATAKKTATTKKVAAPKETTQDRVKKAEEKASKAEKPVKAEKAEKPEKVAKVEKTMSTEEMKTYAKELGIAYSSLNKEELIAAINVPEVGEKVSVIKKKDLPAENAIYRGYFQCELTGKFYARLHGTKRFIKQLSKVQRHEA